jgi:hypothetical protein
MTFFIINHQTICKQKLYQGENQSISDKKMSEYNYRKMVRFSIKPTQYSTLNSVLLIRINEYGEPYYWTGTEWLIDPLLDKDIIDGHTSLITEEEAKKLMA